MLDHYKTLGLEFPASHEEIRRAYRTLARRYHPDVNPGAKSGEKFREISLAYDVLGDPEKKKEYDKILEAFEHSEETIRSAHAAYKRASDAKQFQKKHTSPDPIHAKGRPNNGIFAKTGKVMSKIKGSFGRQTKTTGKRVNEIAILEVSIGIKEAVFGMQKTLAFAEGNQQRNISVPIPAGSYSGSIVRLREKKTENEELVVVIRVNSDGPVSISEKGVMVEVPINIQEAIYGAKIEVATLLGNHQISVPESTQSGHVLKVPGKGVTYKDNSRGDLFVKFLVQVPDEPRAAGLREAVESVQRYYLKGVR